MLVVNKSIDDKPPPFIFSANNTVEGYKSFESNVTKYKAKCSSITTFSIG